MEADELRSRLTAAHAPDLLEAVDFSRHRLASLSGVIETGAHSYPNTPAVGYVVSGSLGRLEALEASDVDLIALCQELTPLETARAYDQHIRAVVRSSLKCDVSSGDNFTGPTYLRDIADPTRIGGNADHVNFLTKRILLLTESRSVDTSGQDLAFRTGALNALISSSSVRRRHYISLADEIVRYYRTLAIDYKSRIDSENKAWAPRYIKLRSSRKYWFFSLVMGLTALWVSYEADPDKAEAELIPTLQRSPTERILVSLEASGLRNQFDVVSFYSRFLAIFRDEAVRHSLETVEYDRRYESANFRNLKRNADRLHRAMLEVFDSVPANWRRHILSRFLLQS